MEQKKTITQLTVAGCFYRYLKLNEFSKVSSVSEIALELGIPEKKVTTWAVSVDNFPSNKDILFWKLTYFFVKKGFTPFEVRFFRYHLRLVIELLFIGVHIDDILKALERDHKGLIKLLLRPKELTVGQARQIRFLRQKHHGREEIAKIEMEILLLMEKLEKTVTDLNGSREKVLLKIKRTNPKMYERLAQIILTQRWAK